MSYYNKRVSLRKKLEKIEREHGASTQTAKLDKILNASLDHHVIILLNGKIALLMADKVINDK